MKKTKCYLMIALTALFFVSCGGSSKGGNDGDMINAATNSSMSAMGSSGISQGNSNDAGDYNAPANSGPKYYGENYESACKDLNFEAAHKILKELRKDYYHRSDDYEKAFDYVYTAEVSYLLNTFPIEDARPKILFLLQECDDKESDTYIKLCEKICTLLISGENNDFAIEVVRTLANKYIDRGINDEYFTCFETVYKAVVDNFVNSYTGKESVAKIAKMMHGIPVEGSKITASGVFSRYAPDAYWHYRWWCTRYNRVCDHILTLAINNNNNDLAKAALLLYREEVDFIYSVPDDGIKYNIIEGVQVPTGSYYGKLQKESFNEAKKKYDQAVALGILTE